MSFDTPPGTPESGFRTPPATLPALRLPPLLRRAEFGSPGRGGPSGGGPDRGPAGAMGSIRALILLTMPQGCVENEEATAAIPSLTLSRLQWEDLFSSDDEEEDMLT